MLRYSQYKVQNHAGQKWENLVRSNYSQLKSAIRLTITLYNIMQWSAILRFVKDEKMTLITVLTI